MNILQVDRNTYKKFGPYTLVTGIFLVILGFIGIVFPTLMSLATSIFIAWLLLIGGIFWAIHTYRYSPRSFMGWIKPALLLVAGGLLFFYPTFGVETIGLLLVFYLFLDAIGSFSLARFTHPAKGWGWMAFNGVISVLLATLFLVGWPGTSLWLVGLFIGISLLFDGWALVAIGWALRKGEKNE